MIVYLHIAKIEATTKTCGRADPENAPSYDKVYATYHDEIGPIVMKIGFLIGQEARFQGVGKDTLLDFVESRVNIVAQEAERMAELDSIKFMDLCRNLPKAAAAKVGPFEPLAQRFPEEMNIIQRIESTGKLPRK